MFGFCGKAVVILWKWLKREFNVEQSIKYSPSVLFSVFFFSCKTHKSPLLIAHGTSCVKGRAEYPSSAKMDT